MQSRILQSERALLAHPCDVTNPAEFPIRESGSPENEDACSTRELIARFKGENEQLRGQNESFAEALKAFMVQRTKEVDCVSRVFWICSRNFQ